MYHACVRCSFWLLVMFALWLLALVAMSDIDVLEDQARASALLLASLVAGGATTAAKSSSPRLATTTAAKSTTHNAALEAAAETSTRQAGDHALAHAIAMASEPTTPPSPPRKKRRGREAEKAASPSPEYEPFQDDAAEASPSHGRKSEDAAATRLRPSVKSRCWSAAMRDKARSSGQPVAKDIWDDKEFCDSERAVAIQMGCKMKERGPPGPAEGGPTIWKGQAYRAAGDRWGNRGGSRREWFKLFHSLTARGDSSSDAAAQADAAYPNLAMKCSSFAAAAPMKEKKEKKEEKWKPTWLNSAKASTAQASAWTPTRILPAKETTAKASAWKSSDGK